MRVVVAYYALQAEDMNGLDAVKVFSDRGVFKLVLNFCAVYYYRISAVSKRLAEAIYGQCGLLSLA